MKQDRKCIKADGIIRDFINAASCGTEKGKERGVGPNYVLEQTHVLMESKALQTGEAAPRRIR